eukprot:3257945-Amphidinium_carterae.1
MAAQRFASKTLHELLTVIVGVKFSYIPRKMRVCVCACAPAWVQPKVLATCIAVMGKQAKQSADTAWVGGRKVFVQQFSTILSLRGLRERMGNGIIPTA